MPISQQLRDIIRASGLSLNQIAKATAVSQPILSRFITDTEAHRDIRLERTADKLAAFFNLELTECDVAANGEGKKSKPATKPKPASASRRPKKPRG